jgi:hypothetical protein
VYNTKAVAFMNVMHCICWYLTQRGLIETPSNSSLISSTVPRAYSPPSRSGALTNLVRLGAEVGVLYVPGVMNPFPELLGVPPEKAGLSERAILELPLERGDVKLPAEPGPGENWPESLTRVGVTGYSGRSRRDAERDWGVEGKTGGGVCGSDAVVGSGGGVTSRVEGADPFAEELCEREAAAENKSRGDGTGGGVNAPRSC